MAEQHAKYAARLIAWWTRREPSFSLHPDCSHRVVVTNEGGDPVTMDFMPFELTPRPATAGAYFADVATTTDLLAAYHAASHSVTLESDLPSLSDRLHPYATEFLHAIIARARTSIDDGTATRIAHWVKHFDVYVAVKTVESLFNSHADRVLLEVAEEQNWVVLFDHLAIRCGSAENRAAKQVAALLCQQHGYTPAGVEDERMYRFTDGWNAYPLYKILENGQVLRLFLDESDGSNPVQIIQHWNRVYGYTAHHLALRVTQRIGIPTAGVEGQQMYRFTDGWNAYPLYKILENGQVLRLFLDESDGSNPVQIIQHWNRVYGYTAHHLALRVTQRIDGERQAVPLNVLADTLNSKGIRIMAPTGGYTHGLLVQVFARPDWNPDIPADIKNSLSVISPSLESVIKNGKLLELLSRTEAPLELAHAFFALYGLTYDVDNPMYSVPVYHYFLPAQAAHVIRTSTDTRYKKTA